MLTLSRKTGESFFIGEDIEITISDIGSERVKVTIDAPREIKILRKELKELKDINKESAQETTNPEIFKSLLKKVKKD
ncbi:MAG: carbon storage regulator [Oscillospiraceae bacterium]